MIKPPVDDVWGDSDNIVARTAVASRSTHTVLSDDPLYEACLVYEVSKETINEKKESTNSIVSTFIKPNAKPVSKKKKKLPTMPKHNDPFDIDD